jgi:hypothetical protein
MDAPRTWWVGDILGKGCQEGETFSGEELTAFALSRLVDVETLVVCTSKFVPGDR